MGSPAMLAEWSEKMRIKEDDDDRTVLSKKLSFVLRHGAKTMELPIDDGGYVRISDLLAIDQLFGGVQPEDLIEVAEQSNRDKQRYEVWQDGDEWLMRATGKHTIQGLQGEKPVKDKKARRSDRKEAAGGDRAQRQQRHLSEDEFCARWKLDKFARARLNELPAASRQLAMRRFSPGPQVPASDFPKVFVVFCKRFRGKGKDEAYGVEFDDKLDYEALGSGSSPSGGRSSTTARSRGKKKSGKSKDSHEAIYSRGSGGHHEEPDVQDDKNQFYPSPGSTPRSFDGSMSPPPVIATMPSPTGLAMTQLHQPPMHGPPSSPLRSAAPPRPPLATPPPPAFPPHGVPTLPANVGHLPHGLPPPPSHVPQVAGLAPDRSSGRVGGYKEMSFPGLQPCQPPGQQLGVPRSQQLGPPGQQCGAPPGQQGQPCSPTGQQGQLAHQLAQGWGRGSPSGYLDAANYAPSPVLGYSPPRADGIVRYSEVSSQYGSVHESGGPPQSCGGSPTQAYYSHMGTSSHPGSPQGARPEMFYGQVDPSSQSSSPQGARSTVPEGYQNGMMMGGWMPAGAR